MLNLYGKLETLSVPKNPAPLSSLTRVVLDRSDGHKLILDNGSAPLVLDAKLACRDIRKPTSKISFQYGTTTLKDIQVGKNAIELFTSRDIGDYNALCVDGLKDKIGAVGVVGLAPAGSKSCLSDDGSDTCLEPEAKYAFMNINNFYDGFRYRSTRNPFQNKANMVPIKAQGPKAEFSTVDSPNDLKIMYTSTKRPEKKQYENPYSIFQLGWPPEFNKLLKDGKPCYHGAQFFGAGELSDLEVNYRKNQVRYSFAPGVSEDRCP